MSAYRFAVDVLEEVLRLLGERPELVQVSRTVWIRADRAATFAARKDGKQ